MQKIKNTTLVRDLPGIPAGTKGKLWNAGNGEGYGYRKNQDCRNRNCNCTANWNNRSSGCEGNSKKEKSGL